MVETKMQFGWLFTLLVLMLAVGTLAFQSLEQWTFIDSFYFTATTLTTIGYGDLAPTTDLSKIVTVVFALSGVTVFLYGLSVITSYYIKRGQEFEEYEKKKIREIISNIQLPFKRKKGLRK